VLSIGGEAEGFQNHLKNSSLEGAQLFACCIRIINLNSAVAGLKMAHLLEITSAFEFAVLTLTVPGLRFRKYQNPLCFRVSAPFSSSLTAEFRINDPRGYERGWPESSPPGRGSYGSS
jgi:hypothetical protein